MTESGVDNELGIDDHFIIAAETASATGYVALELGGVSALEESALAHGPQPLRVSRDARPMGASRI